MVVEERPIYADEFDTGQMYELELNDGLTEAERKEAAIFKHLSIGTMFIHGVPGSGKGLFANQFGWKMRRYFKERKIFMDYFPKAAYDRYGLPYEPAQYNLFNAGVMSDELNRMRIQSAGKKQADIGADESGNNLTPEQQRNVKNLSKQWVEGNEVRLRKAIFKLDELKRYFHNRSPGNRYGKMLGQVLGVQRHLDLLIIGSTPFAREIDAISWIPYVTIDVSCTWSLSRPYTTDATVKVGQYVSVTGIVKVIDELPIQHVSGAEPVPQLGMWLYPDKVIPRRFMSSEQLAIVEVIESVPGISLPMAAKQLNLQIDDVNELVMHLTKRGHIQCGKYFDLFHSKDIKDLKPELGK